MKKVFILLLIFTIVLSSATSVVFAEELYYVAEHFEFVSALSEKTSIIFSDDILLRIADDFPTYLNEAKSTVTVNLNEKTLSLNNENLTLNNNIIITNGTINCGNNSIIVDAKGKNIELSDVTIISSSNDVALQVKNGSVVLTNCHFNPDNGESNYSYAPGASLIVDGYDVVNKTQVGTGSGSNPIIPSKGNSTTVTHTVNEPTYTVTIPSSVSLGNTGEVKIENAQCPNGYEVTVTLSGTSGDNDEFSLVNESSENEKLSYQIYSGESLVKVNDVIVRASNGEATATLDFKKPTGLIAAGVYSGTITFTVAWGRKA